MMRTTDRRNNRRKTSGRGPRALARWLLTLVVGLGGSGLGETLWAGEGDRAFGVAPVSPDPVSAPAPGRVDIKGNYWAVLIGIDEYTDDRIADLESPVKDVTDVGEVLQTRYGFASTRIKLLLNAAATRSNILNTFHTLQMQTKEADSVFIYYAGHGQYQKLERVEHGWWVPADAKSKDFSTFITNEDVLKYIKGMKARHVYLVADSCFSGSLFGTRSLPPINDRWFAALYKERSRWGFTSGSTEPVADTGSEGHSPFAYFLLKTLRENQEPYLVPSRIYDQVGPLVTNNAEQKPKSEPLKGAGDHGGQFVFRLTDVTGGSPTVRRPTTPAVSPVTHPAPGPSKKKPKNKWKTMLELLDELLEEKTS